MLKTRVIPILLWDGEKAVKTKQFRRPPRTVGNMMDHVLIMQERDVDELIIIDIDATYDQREPNYSKIEKFAQELYCPLTIGGNVSTIQNIKNLLNSGADKVAIKSGFNDKAFIEAAVQKFGKQCIVRAADFKNLDGALYEGEPEESPYFGELLLTSVPHEGMMQGYNVELIELLSKVNKCPIIANGGAGSLPDFYLAIEAGASAVAAGSIFLYTDITPKDVSEYLVDRGIPCRI